MVMNSYWKDCNLSWFKKRHEKGKQTKMANEEIVNIELKRTERDKFASESWILFQYAKNNINLLVLFEHHRNLVSACFAIEHHFRQIENKSRIKFRVNNGEAFGIHQKIHHEPRMTLFYMQ